MKIYKYWIIEKAIVKFDREEKEIKCYGGSNISIEDASVKAREKIERIQNKIEGNHHEFDTYEVEIREEIVQELDEKAIVTRNRYGAKVLNVQDLMILDIDKPKYSFWDFFKKTVKPKTKIVEMIRSLSQKSKYKEYGFRIYETYKGIRVIVLGKTFDPKAPATWWMMKEFNCDMLYMILCQKQNCFRARLTPKPGRMKLQKYKVVIPRSDEEEHEFRTWLAEYELRSRNYSVCKFIEQIGSGKLSEAVRLHDEITGVNWSQKLA